MLIIDFYKEDPAKELFLTRYLSHKMAELFEKLYLKITGSTLTAADKKDKEANEKLGFLFPNAFPRKKMVEKYLSTYYLLLSETFIDADIIQGYTIYQVLSCFEKEEIALDQKDLNDPMELLCFYCALADISIEEEESNKKQADEWAAAFKTAEDILDLYFPGYDPHLVDALSRYELKHSLKDTERLSLSIYEFIYDFDRKAGGSDSAVES